MQNDKTINIGKVIGLHGVKGWLKILSFSSPPENIFNYKSLIISNKYINQIFHIEDSRKQGKKILIKLDNIDDRTSAESLKESDIYIQRSDLPQLSEDTYYWEDLLGFNVFNQNNIKIGNVDSFIETGSNDVLIVKTTKNKNILIPFIMNKSIKVVNIESHYITVDWED
ncbi:MAG: ribosome maturation factor RimM [Gammaproteobacteria bacterium]|jgi:16S rRNA processing protein RimM|nr:ribosome maturation factor RimM [Gammaproteobacteria bacterium]MBT6073844.1 ribosome maturation factor RimM [Gammaproteobacteria bacterium]